MVFPQGRNYLKGINPLDAYLRGESCSWASQELRLQMRRLPGGVLTELVPLSDDSTLPGAVLAYTPLLESCSCR